MLIAVVKDLACMTDLDIDDLACRTVSKIWILEDIFLRSWILDIGKYIFEFLDMRKLLFGH